MSTLNRSIGMVDVHISTTVRKLMVKHNMTSYALAKYLAGSLKADLNSVKARLSSYLNNKSRWQKDYITALTYIFGVSLEELYGEKEKNGSSTSFGEIDKAKFIDKLVEDFRVFITHELREIS